jgi:hypothetical protein
MPLEIERSERWADLEPCAKAFVVVVSVECLSLVGLLVQTLVKLAATESLIYLAVLCFYMVAGFAYFSLDAVFKENHFQLVVAQAVHVFIWLFSIYDYFTDLTGEDDTLEKTVVAICVSLVQIFYPINAYYVWSSFGYRRINLVGSRPENIEMFNVLQTYLSLLKFDVVAAGYVLLLSSFFRYSFSELEYILLAVAFVFSLAWSRVGYLAVVKEEFTYSTWFLVLSWVGPAYLIYKVIEICQHAAVPERDVNTARIGAFFFCAGCFMILRAMLVVWSRKCSDQFGKGLKERIFVPQEFTSFPVPSYSN